MTTCPLCDSALRQGECPVCNAGSAPGGEGDTDRESTNSGPAPSGKAEAQPKPKDAKANWYALAGMERPPEVLPDHTPDAAESAPLTNQREEDGYGAAAMICFARGLSEVVKLAAGLQFAVFDAIISFFIGAALLRGASYGKPLLIVGALWSIAQGVLALVLVGHWSAVLVMLPGVAMLATFWLDTPRDRTIAAVVGALLAFQWIPFYAFTKDKSPDEAMREYALPGNTWSDPSGVRVVAPQGVMLIDPAQMLKKAKGEVRGILGMALKSKGTLELNDERLLALGSEKSMVAVYKVGAIPPHMKLEAALVGRVSNGKYATRNDDVIPESIRKARVEAQGWSLQDQRIVLARLPNGQLLSVACSPMATIGERMCEALLAGTTLPSP